MVDAQGYPQRDEIHDICADNIIFNIWFELFNDPIWSVEALLGIFKKALWAGLTHPFREMQMQSRFQSNLVIS